MPPWLSQLLSQLIETCAPWPPQLTEAWAAEYLEVIVALLVFALGIPALILQFAVPEELRSVSRHRLRVLRWSAFVVSVTIALGALVFVWPLHPCSTVPTSPDQDRTVASTQGRVGAAIIVAVVLLTLVFWLIQTGDYRRDAVIRHLKKRCASNVRRRGILAEGSLADLIYLGEQGDPGREKGQVLEALDDLAARMQDKAQYAGDGLAELVQGIETTVTGSAKSGNLSNFLQAVKTLEGILLQLRRRKLSAAPDAATVLLTLERLGVASLRLRECERAATAILQAVASATERGENGSQFASQRLFKIGASALADSKHFLVAVTALSKLEALAERRIPLKGEVAADLLGLLAQFWTSGRTARRHARSVLERMGGYFDPSLEDCIEAAIEHQYITAQFDTADKLADMLEDLKEGTDRLSVN